MDNSPKHICLDYLLGLCRGLRLLTFGYSICFKFDKCHECQLDTVNVIVNKHTQSFYVSIYLIESNIVDLISDLDLVRAEAQDFPTWNFRGD